MPYLFLSNFVLELAKGTDFNYLYIFTKKLPLTAMIYQKLTKVEPNITAIYL